MQGDALLEWFARWIEWCAPVDLVTAAFVMLAWNLWRFWPAPGARRRVRRRRILTRKARGRPTSRSRLHR